MIPYPDQISAVEAAVRHHRGVIQAVTGFGKSVTMALLIQKLQVKTLIVVPNLELKTQLRSTFMSYFGNLDNITIENIDSKNLEKFSDYDCLIIDEAHHVAAKTYRKLNSKVWTKIYYRYFFTATPFRSRKEDTILFESVAGQIIYRVGYKTAVQKGYIAPAEPYYYDLKKVKPKGKIKKYGDMYSELIVNKEDRNNLIADLVSSLYHSNISTLVLVKQIEHGKIIQDLLNKKGLDIPFANGQDENSRIKILEFSLKEIPVLIASSIVGEGVDTKPCEYVILAGGTGKSSIQLLQNCGRALRKYPGKDSGKIIAFREASHKWFVDHFRFFYKTIAEEYDVLPEKLEVGKNE